MVLFSQPRRRGAPLGSVVTILVDEWSRDYLNDAMKGNNDAALIVAQCYMMKNGWGCIKHNTEEAKKWAQKVAEDEDKEGLSSAESILNTSSGEVSDVSVYSDLSIHASDGSVRSDSPIPASDHYTAQLQHSVSCDELYDNLQQQQNNNNQHHHIILPTAHINHVRVTSH